MVTRFCGLLLAVLALPVFAARIYYTGAINKTLAIQMELNLAGGTATGSYFYETAGADIPLAGTRTGNALTLTETVDGKKTGTFTGKLSPDLHTISGNWASADKTRKLPFTLNAAAGYRTVSVAKPWYKLTASYPAFLNTDPAWRQINARLAARAKDALRDFETATPHDNPEMPGFELNLDIAVAYLDETLLSLRVTNFEFTGGAHPDTLFAAWNYAMGGDAPKQLGLRDLFASADPQTALFPLVQADLQRQTKARDVEMWDTFSKKDLTVYTLRATALTFTFAATVVSTYVAGPFQVTIPYRVVAKDINWNGPLAPFLRMGNPGTKPGVDPVTRLETDRSERWC